jgi:hypothetical protein
MLETLETLDASGRRILVLGLRSKVHVVFLSLQSEQSLCPASLMQHTFLLRQASHLLKDQLMLM